MTTPIEVGWVLVGKEADSYGDYEVLGASERPAHSAKAIQGLVLATGSGNLPARNAAGVEALPWVMVANGERRSDLVTGLAVHEWSEHFDAQGRSIGRTRLFLITHTPGVDPFPRLSDLYAAVQDRALPPAAEPIVVTPPRGGVEAIARTVHAIGMEPLAAAAAALLSGPVALLDTPAGLVERLEVLDAVLALVPAAMRTRAQVGTWDRRELRLVCAQSARPDQTGVPLRGTPAPLADAAAERYRREVLRLARSKDLSAVTAHLDALVAPEYRELDADRALAALSEIDLVDALVQRSIDGDARPADLRKVATGLRAAELASHPEIPLVLRRYLETATAADLREDQVWLLSLWPRPEQWPEAGQVLVELGRTRLWVHGWESSDVLAVVDLAAKLGVPDTIPRLLESPPHGASPAALGVAAEITNPADPDPRLDRVIAADPGLAVSVVGQFLSRDPNEARAWMGRLESVGPSRGWSEVAEPFRIVLTHGRGLRAEHLDIVHRRRPDLVSSLVRVVDRVPGLDRSSLAALVDGWYRSVDHDLDTTTRSAWRSTVLALARHRPRVPRLDVMLIRWDRVSDEPWTLDDLTAPYLDELEERLTRSEYGVTDRVRWAGTVAAALPEGWSRQRATADRLLELLWTLSHDGRDEYWGDSALLAVVLEPVARFLLPRPTSAARRWAESLGRDRTLERPLRVAVLREAIRTYDAVEAARAAERLLRLGAPPEEVADEIVRESDHPLALTITSDVAMRLNKEHEVTRELFGRHVAAATLRHRAAEADRLLRHAVQVLQAHSGLTAELTAWYGQQDQQPDSRFLTVVEHCRDLLERALPRGRNWWGGSR